MTSIINQTLKDIEIIMVDDGSPDNCPAMCDEYAKIDPRIKVFHQVNGGVTSARKLGVDSAIGGYIFFVDGDDDLPINALDQIYSFLVQNHIDILVTAVNRVVDGRITNVSVSEISGSIDKYSYIKAMLRGECRVGPYARLIKRALFASANAFDIPREVVVNEDHIMNMILGSAASSIYISNDIISYNYHIIATGASRTKCDCRYWEMTFKHFRRLLNQHFSLTPDLEDAFTLYKLSKIYNLKWVEIYNLNKSDFIKQVKTIRSINLKHKKMLLILKYPKISIVIRMYDKVIGLFCNCKIIC